VTGYRDREVTIYLFDLESLKDLSILVLSKKFKGKRLVVTKEDIRTPNVPYLR
jgi:hypothetical protein